MIKVTQNERSDSQWLKLYGKKFYITNLYIDATRFTPEFSKKIFEAQSKLFSIAMSHRIPVIEIFETDEPIK